MARAVLFFVRALVCMARAVLFFVRACVCMARAVLFFVRASVFMARAVLFFVRASVLKSLSLKKGRTQNIWKRGVIYCGLLSFIMVYRLFSIFCFCLKQKTHSFQNGFLLVLQIKVLLLYSFFF
jgi:hypothetical protein